MQSIKLIVILYQRELYFRKTTNLRILAKIKLLRTFPDLQYQDCAYNFTGKIMQSVFKTSHIFASTGL